MTVATVRPRVNCRVISPPRSTSWMPPVATDGVACSVGLSVTTMSPVKTAEGAEPIEMLFRMWTRVGSRYHILHRVVLWLPVVMVALCNRADHYILPCDFYLRSSFFPRLISAVGDWMSTILPHMVWP